MKEIGFKPFKVVCTNGDGWYWEKKFLFWKKNIDTNGPVKDAIYTVIGTHYSNGVYFYNLAEWPEDPNGDGWEASCFKPVYGDFQKITYEKVMQEESKFVNAN